MDFCFGLLCVGLVFLVLSLAGYGFWTFIFWAGRQLFGDDRPQAVDNPLQAKTPVSREFPAGGEVRQTVAVQEPPKTDPESAKEFEILERWLDRLVSGGVIGKSLAQRLRSHAVLWLQRYRPAPVAPEKPKPKETKPSVDAVVVEERPAKPIPAGPPIEKRAPVPKPQPPKPVAKPSVEAPRPVQPVPASPFNMPPREVQKPKEPVVPRRERLRSFLHSHNIQWAEIVTIAVGGLLIVGPSIALVLSYWKHLEGYALFKPLLFLTLMGAIFGMGLYSYHRWRLVWTGRTLLTIASLLVPLSIIALMIQGQGGDGGLGQFLLGAGILIGASGALVYAGSRAIVPNGPWHVTIGTLGPPTLLVVVGTWLGQLTGDGQTPLSFADAPLASVLAIALVTGLAPVLCFAATVLAYVRRLNAKVAVDEREDVARVLWSRVGRLTALTGISLFATFVTFLMIGLNASSAEGGLARELTLGLVLSAIPLLVTGLCIKRLLATIAPSEDIEEGSGDAKQDEDETRELFGLWHAVGTGWVLLGALGMGVALVLAWPAPALLLANALLAGGMLAWLAHRHEQPLLSGGVAGSAALACIAGFATYQAAGEGVLADGGWRMPQPVSWLAEAYGDPTIGMLLGAVALAMLAFSEIFLRGKDTSRWPAAAAGYAIGAGVTALVSLAYVAKFPFEPGSADAARMMLACAVYGLTCFIMARRSRAAWLLVVGMVLTSLAPLLATRWLWPYHVTAPDAIWAIVLGVNAFALNLLALRSALKLERSPGSDGLSETDMFALSAASLGILYAVVGVGSWAGVALTTPAAYPAIAAGMLLAGALLIAGRTFRMPWPVIAGSVFAFVLFQYGWLADAQSYRHMAGYVAYPTAGAWLSTVPHRFALACLTYASTMLAGLYIARYGWRVSSCRNVFELPFGAAMLFATAMVPLAWFESSGGYETAHAHDLRFVIDAIWLGVLWMIASRNMALLQWPTPVKVFRTAALVAWLCGMRTFSFRLTDWTASPLSQGDWLAALPYVWAYAVPILAACGWIADQRSRRAANAGADDSMGHRLRGLSDWCEDIAVLIGLFATFIAVELCDAARLVGPWDTAKAIGVVALGYAMIAAWRSRWEYAALASLFLHGGLSFGWIADYGALDSFETLRGFLMLHSVTLSATGIAWTLVAWRHHASDIVKHLRTAAIALPIAGAVLPAIAGALQYTQYMGGAATSAPDALMYWALLVSPVALVVSLWNGPSRWTFITLHGLLFVVCAFAVSYFAFAESSMRLWVSAVVLCCFVAMSALVARAIVGIPDMWRRIGWSMDQQAASAVLGYFHVAQALLAAIGVCSAVAITLTLRFDHAWFIGELLSARAAGPMLLCLLPLTAWVMGRLPRFSVDVEWNGALLCLLPLTFAAPFWALSDFQSNAAIIELAIVLATSASVVLALVCHIVPLVGKASGQWLEARRSAELVIAAIFLAALAVMLGGSFLWGTPALGHDATLFGVNPPHPSMMILAGLMMLTVGLAAVFLMTPGMRQAGDAMADRCYTAAFLVSLWWGYWLLTIVVPYTWHATTAIIPCRHVVLALCLTAPAWRALEALASQLSEHWANNTVRTILTTNMPGVPLTRIAVGGSIVWFLLIAIVDGVRYVAGDAMASPEAISLLTLSALAAPWAAWCFVGARRREAAPVIYALALAQSMIVLSWFAPEEWHVRMWLFGVMLAEFTAVTALVRCVVPRMSWARRWSAEETALQASPGRLDWFTPLQAVLMSIVAIWSLAFSLATPLDSAMSGSIALVPSGSLAFPLRMGGPLAAWLLAATAVLIGMAPRMRASVREGWRLSALAFAHLAACESVWAWWPEDVAAAGLHHAVVVAIVSCLVMAFCAAGGTSFRKVSVSWAEACQRAAPFFGGCGVIATCCVLLLEWAYFDWADGAPMEIWAVVMTAIIMAGFIAGALALAILGPSVIVKRRGAQSYFAQGDGYAWRCGLVYLAEAIAVLIAVHLYLTEPWIYRLGLLAKIWMLVVLLIAFCGAALAHWFERLRLEVLADPLRNTAMFIPLVPAIAYWLPSNVPMHVLTGSTPTLWMLTSAFYGYLAYQRRSAVFGVLAVLAANTGLWSMWHTFEWGFLEHPQLWIMPIALVVLITELVNHKRLGPELSATMRYLGLAGIYLSSSAEYLQTLGESVIMPLVLIGISVAGVMLGLRWRIRSFVTVGFLGVLLVVCTMIWNFGVDKEQTWVLWTACILLGLAIFAGFGYYERHKTHVIDGIRRFRKWGRNSDGGDEQE